MHEEPLAGLDPAAGTSSYGQSPLAPVTRIVSAIGSLMIIAMMALINADVGMRFLFNSPIPGVSEMIAASIVSIIFLQLPDCIEQGRMIRSDMWFDKVLVTRPRLGTAIDAVFHAIGAAMLMLLVYYIFPKVARAFTDGHTIGVYGVFQAPLWPFYLLVLIGAVLAAAEYVIASILRVCWAAGTGRRGAAS
jgi:TRAP-type mannitol/chloroaromatic compound transport system permease small subunit